VSEDLARTVSLAHLTLISVPPVALVRVAAEAGFDAVGLRLVPTSHGIDHKLLGYPSAMRGLRQQVADSGITVLDVEVVRVREPERMADPAPLIDAAAELGARWIITTVEDPDERRRADTFGALCAQAAARGVGISLEYMVFSEVRSLNAAVRLLDEVGAPNAALLVDALHHERSGGTPGEVARISPRLLPYVQVCDAGEAGAQLDPGLARAEAVTARLLPGDGRLPLEELVRAMPTSAALSVEAPLASPDAMGDPLATARRARASAAALVDQQAVVR